MPLSFDFASSVQLHLQHIPWTLLTFEFDVRKHFSNNRLPTRNFGCANTQFHNLRAEMRRCSRASGMVRFVGIYTHPLLVSSERARQIVSGSYVRLSRTCFDRWMQVNSKKSFRLKRSQRDVSGWPYSRIKIFKIRQDNSNMTNESITFVYISYHLAILSFCVLTIHVTMNTCKIYWFALHSLIHFLSRLLCLILLVVLSQVYWSILSARYLRTASMYIEKKP